jgi:hypothetical protein
VPVGKRTDSQRRTLPLLGTWARSKGAECSFSFWGIEWNRAIIPEDFSNLKKRQCSFPFKVSSPSALRKS